MPDLTEIPPARDYYAEAQSIAKGETLRIPEPRHLLELIYRLATAEESVRFERRVGSVLAGRALRAEGKARRLRTALEAVLTTLDAVADERTVPVSRCLLARNAARSMRQFLAVEDAPDEESAA